LLSHRPPTAAMERLLTAAHPDYRTDTAAKAEGAALTNKPALSTSETMRALCWHGAQRVSVDATPKPLLTEAGDAVVRITTTTVCGSDLHLYFNEVQGMTSGACARVNKPSEEGTGVLLAEAAAPAFQTTPTRSLLPAPVPRESMLPSPCHARRGKQASSSATRRAATLRRWARGSKTCSRATASPSPR
jgi:hypothetical protein